MSQRTSIPWVSLYVQGFADSPVSWGLKEHQFYTNGDNNYVLFLQPKGSYLACSYISSNKRPKSKSKKWSRRYQLKCYEVNVSILINRYRDSIYNHYKFSLHTSLLFFAFIPAIIRIPSHHRLDICTPNSKHSWFWIDISHHKWWKTWNGNIGKTHHTLKVTYIKNILSIRLKCLAVALIIQYLMWNFCNLEVRRKHFCS